MKLHGVLYSFSFLAVACVIDDSKKEEATTGLFGDRDPDETITGAVSSRVEIARDELGIPHIYAATLEDAAFAQGYMHARDRFFQIDLFRHLVEGRLSEYFGDITLGTDLQNRAKMTMTDGRPVYDVMAEQASEKERTVLDAYSAGVNVYITLLKSGEVPAPVAYDVPLLSNWTPDLVLSGAPPIRSPSDGSRSKTCRTARPPTSRAATQRASCPRTSSPTWCGISHRIPSPSCRSSTSRHFTARTGAPRFQDAARRRSAYRRTWASTKASIFRTCSTRSAPRIPSVWTICPRASKDRTIGSLRKSTPTAARPWCSTIPICAFTSRRSSITRTWTPRITVPVTRTAASLAFPFREFRACSSDSTSTSLGAPPRSATTSRMYTSRL